MPRYVVKRTFPERLRIPAGAEGRKRCLALVERNGHVSEDAKKTFCIYDAPSPEAIRKTTARNDLPIDRITQVRVPRPVLLPVRRDAARRGGRLRPRGGAMIQRLAMIIALAVMTATLGGMAQAAGGPVQKAPTPPMEVTLLADGLQGTVGGTIGPDGALYVAEAALGQITRIDPSDGSATQFASGLPPQVIPLGGAIDVAFVGTTMYVLVTVVGPDVGGTSVDGIYERNSLGGFDVFADLGAWSILNPPSTQFDLPSGVQFALQPVADGFLVTDGHHNRVLHVSSAGEVTQLIQFENIVPTGLAVTHGTVFMSQAGPVPHEPATGKVVSFPLNAPRPHAHDIASGFSLLVDVESGPDGALYALSQGDSPGNVPPASPASPDSGRLLLVNRDGSFSVLVDELNLPTSLDFVGDTAFVTTLNGEVWKITHVSKH